MTRGRSTSSAARTSETIARAVEDVTTAVVAAIDCYGLMWYPASVAVDGRGGRGGNLSCGDLALREAYAACVLHVARAHSQLAAQLTLAPWAPSSRTHELVPLGELGGACDRIVLVLVFLDPDVLTRVQRRAVEQAGHSLRAGAACFPGRQNDKKTASRRAL